MYPMIFVLIVMVVISPAPSAPPPADAARNNHRFVRDTSERLIFVSDSAEESSNQNAGRAGVSRSTTTLRPPMTFRGRAPSRIATTPNTTAIPTTTTTERNWLRKLVPTAMPNFINRVGEFFGKKTTVSASSPATEATTPLLKTVDEGGDDGTGSNNSSGVDIRVIIDAPEFDCPSGQRRLGSRCRTIV